MGNKFDGRILATTRSQEERRRMMSEEATQLILIAVTVGAISLVYIFTLFLIFVITVLSDRKQKNNEDAWK
jgi:hypothetical protein